MNKLPEFCYSSLIDGTIIIIKRGEIGYHNYKGLGTVDMLNENLGITKPQVEAMRIGSIFGWDSPLADPSRYDENGELIFAKNDIKK